MTSLLLLALLAPSSPASSEEIVQRVGPLRVIGKQLPMLGPAMLQTMLFARSGWLRRFSVKMLDERLNASPDDSALCHVSFRMPHGLTPTLGEGITDMEFPQGYGLPIQAGLPYTLNAMLQSDSASTDAEYSFEVRFDVADAETSPPLKSLEHFMRTLQARRMGAKTLGYRSQWWVPPGTHT